MLSARQYFFLFDDFALVGESAHLPLHQLVIHPLFKFYRPVVFLITRASFAMFGWEMPWAHLALSQLVHVGNAALVYRLMVGLRQTPRAAGVGAVLFLFSPWATEAYFWLSGRFDVFSTCGVLIAMLMALRVADAPTAREAWRAGWLGAAGAVLAVFSKETGIVAPVMCAGALLAGRPWSVVARVAPMVFVGATGAVCAIYLVVRQLLLPNFDGAYGQLGTLAGNSNILANFMTYLRAPLVAPFPGMEAGSAVSWWVLSSAALLAVAAWWTVRAAAPRVAALAVAGFVLAVAPVVWMPLVPYSSAGGRLMYGAGIWVCVIAGLTIGRVAKPAAAVTLTAVVLTGASVSVWHQSRIWTQASAISRHAIDAFAPFVDRGINAVIIPELPFLYADGPYVLKDYAFAAYFHARQVPTIAARPMVLKFSPAVPAFAGWLNDAPEPSTPEGTVVVSVVPPVSGLPARFQLEPARVGLPLSTTHVVAAPSAQWTIDVTQAPHLEVSPVSGTGPAMVTITRRGAAADHDSTLTLPVTVDGRMGAAVLEVVEVAANADVRAPIGWVDVPAGVIEPASAPIVFQGWALDETQLQSVWVGYRDGEDRVVSLGPAVRRGERPDVTAAYRGFPGTANSAWSFVLDAATIARLPRPLTIRVFAEDASGHRSELGVRELR